MLACAAQPQTALCLLLLSPRQRPLTFTTFMLFLARWLHQSQRVERAKSVFISAVPSPRLLIGTGAGASNGRLVLPRASNPPVRFELGATFGFVQSMVIACVVQQVPLCTFALRHCQPGSSWPWNAGARRVECHETACLAWSIDIACYGPPRTQQQGCFGYLESGAGKKLRPIL